MLYRRLISAAVALAASTLALTACGGGDDTTKAESSATPSAATAPAGKLSITDPWVKAADRDMTGVFGVLVNNTDAQINIVSGSAAISPMVELHEVVGTGGMTKMQPKKGGFVIPADGRLELKPGGFHIMLMGLTKPIKPGDQVAITLKLSDGTSFEFTALGKSFMGGNEKYQTPSH